MRKWKIEFQFKNGRTHFTFFTLTDIANFIKQNKTKKEQTLPINKWIIAMVFDRAAHTVCPLSELKHAIIFKED